MGGVEGGRKEEEGRIKRGAWRRGGGGVRGQCLVPRVARGCQPQDNNFIIGGITLARRGTVRGTWRGRVHRHCFHPDGRDERSLLAGSISLGTRPWVRYGRIIIESLYPLSKYHGARATAEL